MKTLILWAALAAPACGAVTARPWSMARPAPVRAPQSARYCPPRIVILNQPRFYGVAPQRPVEAVSDRPAWTNYSGPVFGNAVTYSQSTADLDAPIRYVEPVTIWNPHFKP